MEEKGDKYIVYTEVNYIRMYIISKCILYAKSCRRDIQRESNKKS